MRGSSLSNLGMWRRGGQRAGTGADVETGEQSNWAVCKFLVRCMKKCKYL